MSDDVIALDGISPSWLANELDSREVVRLRGVLSPEWVEAMRSSVADHVAGHGEGDFYIAQVDREIDSPAHRLVSDPAVRRLFAETTGLRLPIGRSEQRDIRCSMLVRAGTGIAARSNLFHYDAVALTMVVPIFIPRARLGSCGELATFGTKRPFHRFLASHLVDVALTHNPLYRRYVTKRVDDAPEKYVVDLHPGDAYLFWGYRTFHGNLACAPGLLRATLVLHFGEVHSNGWASRMAWLFSRSRRDLGRFEYLPAMRTSPEVSA